MKEKAFVTTDNIFADLDLKNSEELRACSEFEKATLLKRQSQRF